MNTSLPSPSPANTVPLTATESEGLTAATAKAKKIVVAIHGIGDQFRNETIQTVVSAFGRFARYPASMPLGFFHDASNTVRAFQLEEPPAPGEPLSTMAFVEVYWADIPRAAQTAGYIIEDTKAWARTVVERVRARFGDCAGGLDAEGPNRKRLKLRLRQHDYFSGADAIEEMIETFQVLDNLLFIAEKAGILKFDLDHLLTQYVGDVQLVADFADYRNNILNKFREVLDKVCEGNKTAEIYLVAHSEGTVVAFMGLLEAMCHKGPNAKGEAVGEPPGWVRQLRGFMTFGSPIDKHLVLWPQIWDSLQEPHPGLSAFRPADEDGWISWRNYYDYGDPVGFKLDTARDWIKAHGWDKVFAFTDKDDYGFGRYLLPGAAHNDYWGDDAVFGHFIYNVMKVELPKGVARFKEPPGDKPLRRFGANVIPYLLILGLLFLGAYLIFKGMITYQTPSQGAKLGPDEAISGLIRNVSGFTALLAGMIALARIPRLTRAPKMLVPAFFAFGAGAALYGWLVSQDVHNFHTLNQFKNGKEHWLNNHFFQWFGEGARTQLHDYGFTSGRVSAAFVILLAAAVAGFAAWSSRLKLREWTTGFWAAVRPFLVGTRPLILPGTLCVLAVIVYGAITDNDGAHVLWPLMLACAAFIYLWWLAILIFDLVFVWHRYIRFSVAHNYLFALRKEEKKRKLEAPTR